MKATGGVGRMVHRAAVTAWATASALVVLGVACWSVAYGVSWLASPCVSWETTYEEWFAKGTPSGCADDGPRSQLTTHSRAQAILFVAVATLGLLAGGAVALRGALRARAAWFWAGTLLLAVASFPGSYARLVFGPHQVSELGRIDGILGEPFHLGLFAVPPLFVAARVAGLGAWQDPSEVAMKLAAIVLLLADLWFGLPVVLDVHRGQLTWGLLMLMPFLAALAAFAPLPRPAGRGAGPSPEPG